MNGKSGHVNSEFKTTILDLQYDEGWDRSSCFPFNPVHWSVSYVRPTEYPAVPNINEKDIARWREHQELLGRFVITDSHFKIGGFLRSVPKLGDPDRSDLMQSRLRVKNLNKQRKELGLQELNSLTG